MAVNNDRGASKQIDARGPRFGAGITTVVLAIALIAGPHGLGTALIALQVIVFGLGSLVGLQAQPYGRIYAALVKPRLAGPVPLEAPEPPRFAQTVGLVFALVALLGSLVGSAAIFTVAAAFALAAAFLNAAFDYCLGCEMYLLIQRMRQRAA
jgi:hypothetical protein